jgi:hypothetical protein
MNINNITNSVNQINIISNNNYIEKINNLNNFIKSTNLNQKFQTNYELIYDKSNYHLKSNPNIIYDPFNKILYYYNQLNKIKNQYFYSIISAKCFFSNVQIEYDTLEKKQINIELNKKTNIDIDVFYANPSNYYITENLDIIYKNELKINNSEIDSTYYQSDKTYDYYIYHDICYDIPYILEPKNIKYNLDLNLAGSKTVISEPVNKSVSKTKLNLDIKWS